MIFDFLFKKKNKTKNKKPLLKPAQKKVKKSANKSSKKSVKRKTSSRKSASKEPVRSKSAKTKKTSQIKEVLIGRITHFFPKVSAGVIKLRAPLKLQDRVHIRGHTTDFIQQISSLQINNKSIKSASSGKVIGFLSLKRVRRRDKVYKIKP